MVGSARIEYGTTCIFCEVFAFLETPLHATFIKSLIGDTVFKVPLQSLTVRERVQVTVLDIS